MPYIGVLAQGSSNLKTLLDTALVNKCSVVVTPITPRVNTFEHEREPLYSQNESFLNGDMELTSSEWSSRVILIHSNNIDCDSNDELLRKRSEMFLENEISWANHLQSNGCQLLFLRHGNNTNLARIVTRQIKGYLFVCVPLFNTRLISSRWRADVSLEESEELVENQENTWHWWNHFRQTADYNSKLKVVLQLHPDDRPDEQEILRWLGEPIEAVIVPECMFITNASKHPVLPKVWQNLLKHFLCHHVNLIIAAPLNEKLLEYAEYLANFMEFNNDKHELVTYEEQLEVPLQPLKDNLDCYTYEVFEKDPVKYQLYQEAIEAALLACVPEEEAKSKLVILMVLGAGRGPLVRAALNAANNTDRKIRIYVIEKNPNAIRTLNAVKNRLWLEHDVTIFAQDMRDFSPPELADIIVSELLGSFGDNELSPECLDCAQRLLKPNGISIPSSSTSFITPIMSMKLMNSMRSLLRASPLKRDRAENLYNHAEGNFVVLLKNFYDIGAEGAQQVFKFVHPNPQTPIDNNRFTILKFHAKLDCVLNGIAGYFESVLFANIIISINPKTHSQGMMSWFPMFFPFSEPINIKAGDEIEIHFWRRTSNTKVWYEWALTKPCTTFVHNLDGRGFAILCA